MTFNRGVTGDVILPCEWRGQGGWARRTGGRRVRRTGRRGQRTWRTELSVEDMEDEGGRGSGMQKEKEGGMGKNGFVLSGIRS